MLGTHEPTELWWNKTVIYWHENQSAITFHSPLDPTELPERILESLHLDRLNQFLNKNGFNLKSFRSKDVPGPSQPPIPVQSPSQGVIGTIVEKGIELFEKGVKAVEEAVSKSDSLEKPLEPSSADEGNASMVSASKSGGQKWEDDDVDNDKEDDEDGNGENGINSPVGKYLFGSPSGHGTIVIGFFHVTPTSKTSSSSGMMGMGSTRGNNSETPDTTQSLVNLINRNLDKLRQDGDIPLVASMPNWLNGATQDFVSHGCPIVPPIPIQAEEVCATNPDNWPITLPQLSSTMQGVTGKGITVFVLDTIPTRTQIEAAASSAGGNNKLLQSLVARIKAGSIIINHQHVPSRVGNRIVTGKDVYQRLFGFRMPDHGLFVAGIIQDLAPDANIECIRVLNDFGMGDVNIIIAALQNIYNRMQEGGDLHDRQVVINMSLVATPADEELPSLWFGDDCCHAQEIAQMIHELKLLRDSLHLIIQSLTAEGAVVVASAGNDSDFNIGRASMASYMNVGMNMPSRWSTRYPAAFPEVISVGAVDNSLEASQYSNFPALPPQHNGIATYGGGIPTPLPIGSPIPPSVINPPPGAKTWAIVTDAVRGIYSSAHYSELSATDLPPAEYSAPVNNNAWAYWSGTSFATPIISAVAARVLQRLSTGAVLVPIDQLSAKVQWAITNADGQRALLTDSTTALPANSLFGPNVSILKAEQVCHPSKG